MKLISIKIIRNESLSESSPSDFHLFYVLRGTADLKTAEIQLQMNTGDVFVINPGESFQMIAQNGIISDCIISYSSVLRLTGYQRKLIICNTHQIENENTEALQRALNTLLRKQYGNETSPILLEQYSLQLIYLLISNYSNNVFSSDEDNRQNEIAAYIEANYMDEMSLDEIADEFALTPQYFSKYFKTMFGTSFLKYLNSVRLRHAVKELLESDDTVLRIAVANGFANVASFSREFNESYHMPPSVWRRQNKKKNDRDMVDDVISLLKEEQIQENGQTVQIRISPETKDCRYQRYWNEIINVGSFETMMKNRMSDQVTFLHETLKFRRARLFLDTFSENGKHRFYIADSVMEYFVRNHMDLLIVIDFRTYGNQKSFPAYFREQCLRFANRFGTGIQNHTVFEIEYNSEYDETSLAQYRKFRDSIERILKECRFDAEIIGPGCLIDESGENFRRFVRANPKIRTFTIFCAPYSIHKVSGELFLNRQTDPGYLTAQYKTGQRILEEENRTDAKLLIVSWKDRLNDVDVLNETPWRGARIIQSVLAGYGICSSLPLDIPLDLMFDEASYDQTFNSLPGILGSKGIKKPAYHALKLLDQQDSTVAAVGPDYLVTAGDERKYYQILLHNCRRPGYRYYSLETLNQVEDYSPQLFEDQDTKTFEIHFSGLAEGEYLVKTRIVNDENGCAFTKWLDMKYGNDSFIGRGENEYLSAASVIPLSGETYQVGKNGILELKCTLKMNEFRHIHLIIIRN